MNEKETIAVMVLKSEIDKIVKKTKKMELVDGVIKEVTYIDYNDLEEARKKTMI